MLPLVERYPDDTDDEETPVDGQESRTERVTVAVTPFEKKAVKAVAAARDTDESNLLRTTPVDVVLDDYLRIRALVTGEAA